MQTTNNNTTVTNFNIVAEAKKAQKSLIDAHCTLDTSDNAIAINANLSRVNAITNQVKELNATKTNLVSETIKLLNDYIKELKSSEQFSNYQTKPLIKIIKSKLDIKSSLVNTVLNYLEDGLTIQHSLSASALNYVYKAFKDERISKTIFKDEAKLLQKIKSLKDEDKEAKINELIAAHTTKIA